MGGAVVSRCSPAITTETDNMKPTPLDEAAAKANPWKMTTRQCMYMRLIGETGQAKQAAYALGISTKSNSYPNRIRERMGLIGSDLRMYIRWGVWYEDFTKRMSADLRKATV